MFHFACACFLFFVLVTWTKKQKQKQKQEALSNIGIFPLDHIPGVMSAGPASVGKGSVDVSPTPSNANTKVRTSIGLYFYDASELVLPELGFPPGGEGGAGAI